MTPTSSSQSPDKKPHAMTNETAEAFTITCTICDATFAPSPTYQSLIQISATTLETLFMRVCHFCFRCRRLACPECWDTLHGVCGACAQEVNLPFRAEAPHLKGAIFSPINQTGAPHPNLSSSALVCVHRGRFQADPVLSSQSLPANLPRQLVPANSQPANQPGKGGRGVAYYIPVIPLDEQEAAQEQEQEALLPLERFFKVVERVVTAIVFTLLLVILVLIGLAEFSSTANTQIMHLFHVDIRGEIAYLTYLVRQLHW
jgi:hypothetical protein